MFKTDSLTVYNLLSSTQKQTLKKELLVKICWSSVKVGFAYIKIIHIACTIYKSDSKGPMVDVIHALHTLTSTNLTCVYSSGVFVTTIYLNSSFIFDKILLVSK